MKPEAVVWTEGKTDWRHLKRAFEALGMPSRIEFKEFDRDWGDDQLLKQCVALSRVQQSSPTIFVFDRDKDDIVGKIDDASKGFKEWGNNVFSFAIPVPSHRRGQHGICIESYYADDELRIQDSSGRRLFLATEFNPGSGRHISNPTLSVGNRTKIVVPSKHFRLIDSEVYNERNDNVALTKAGFAEHIATGYENFGQVNFTEFNLIATLISRIIATSGPLVDLSFGGLSSFEQNLNEMDQPSQLTAILEAAISASKLAAMTFIAVTVRFYEKRIVEAKGQDARKVRPIRQLLRDNLARPSLSSLSDLCRHCYHLINDDAPSALFSLRAMMSTTLLLQELGQMLDSLEQFLPPPPRKGRSVNKAQLKKPLLDFVFHELASYEDRTEEFQRAVAESVDLESAMIETWKRGFSVLLSLFEPLNGLPFRVRNLERVASDTNEFVVLTTNYTEGRVSLTEEKQAYSEVDSDRLERYELLVNTSEDSAALDLYPFMIIKNDRLFYYGRTKPNGYEYNSVFGEMKQLNNTKVKFTQAALRTAPADLQKLFWAQVTPSISPAGVKTNVPAHGAIIGRKDQIASVMEEIIQIPNQNGILYGPGGVGKTALLLELSRLLLEDNHAGAFKHIIWVSAKRDYYDPFLDTVEQATPQFECLDNVLTSILEFHEMEDASVYSRDDQKALVVECFRDQKTLLIIDNFESVIASAQDEILHFFNLEVKRALRDKPDHFKMVVTSRERVPTGLHQVSLKGLDKSESKELMQKVYELYRHSGLPPLSDEQLDALYEATRGIPLMIKHCYGQIFEYGHAVDSVIKRLSNAPNKVVEFSFSEMFKLLKQDELQRKTILLLELIGRPLMLRQMADILGHSESEIAERVVQLVNFQCVARSTTGSEEKFAISDDVRAFTGRLIYEYGTAVTEIKRQIAKLSIDKRLDYSKDEYNALLVFQGFVANRNYLPAEDFIKQQLKNHPGSILLTLHYAKYLKDIKKRAQDAIQLLEEIRTRSGNDQQVLRLLMMYHTALEFPNFEQAHTYALEVEQIGNQDPLIDLELGRFYVSWSTALKMRPPELDPLKEMQRQQKYRELAQAAIKVLERSPAYTHEWHHLMAQAHFDSWDYGPALQQIEKALSKAPTNSHYTNGYDRFRKEILRKQALYSSTGRHYSDWR